MLKKFMHRCSMSSWFTKTSSMFTKSCNSAPYSVFEMKVNVDEKFSMFEEDHTKFCSAPKIIGELNGQFVKAVKFNGKYTWHKHDVEDELFYVNKGVLKLGLKEADKEEFLELHEGEYIIVPKGVYHCPDTDDDGCEVLLFEPESVQHYVYDEDSGVWNEIFKDDLCRI